MLQRPLEIFLVAMGRSTTPILLTEEGNPLFSSPYEFRYGQADLIRNGKDGAIITTGNMVYRAVQAWQKLKEKGMEVQVFNISCLSDLDIEAILEPPRQERSSPMRITISKRVWEASLPMF